MARLYPGGTGSIRRQKNTPAQLADDLAQFQDRTRRRFPTGAAGEQAMIRAMAEIMVARANDNEACTIDDLKREGFAQADIDRLADRARQRARLLRRDIDITRAA